MGGLKALNTPAAQSSGKDCDGEKKVHMTDQAAARIQRMIQIVKIFADRLYLLLKLKQ